VWAWDLPTEKLKVGEKVGFTFRWLDGRWEDKNFDVVVE
jgi:hypothetical protein